MWLSIRMFLVLFSTNRRIVHLRDSLAKDWSSPVTCRQDQGECEKLMCVSRTRLSIRKNQNVSRCHTCNSKLFVIVFFAKASFKKLATCIWFASRKASAAAADALCCCCWRRIRSSRKRKTEFYWVYRNGGPPPWEGPEKRKIEKTKKNLHLECYKKTREHRWKNTEVERCTVEVREK